MTTPIARRTIYTQLTTKSSQIPWQTTAVRSRPRQAGSPTPTSFASRPRHLEFRRAFGQSAIVLQKEPQRESPRDGSKPFKKPKYVRPAAEQDVDRFLHGRWAAEERRFESSMRKLMEEAPSGWREDPQWKQIFEHRAERLAADMEVIQTRRELYDEMSTVLDLVRQTKFRFTIMDDAAPLVLRNITAIDNAWFAEVRALRLCAIAPIFDVDILRKLGKCLSFALKTLPYAFIRPICAWAKASVKVLEDQRSKENDGKR